MLTLIMEKSWLFYCSIALCFVDVKSMFRQSSEDEGRWMLSDVSVNHHVLTRVGCALRALTMWYVGSFQATFRYLYHSSISSQDIGMVVYPSVRFTDQQASILYTPIHKVLHLTLV